MGNSLGVHVVGGAEAAVTLGRIPCITGLDPAGSFFYLNETDTRLDLTDDDFVNIIHTNGGILLRKKEPRYIFIANSRKISYLQTLLSHVLPPFHGSEAEVDSPAQTHVCVTYGTEAYCILTHVLKVAEGDDEVLEEAEVSVENSK